MTEKYLFENENKNETYFTICTLNIWKPKL